MKKLVIFLAVIVVLFGGMYAINRATNGEKDEKAKELYGVPASQLNPVTVKLLDDPNYQSIIRPAELEKKVLQEKQPSFVYFFASDCPHCARMTPILSPMAKELNVELPQFNVLEYKADRAKYKIVEWPVLAYYKDGKEVERLVGEQSESTYRAFFNKYK
ncbi:thioredoxin [Paenibacillus sp. J31TS4]|uniref:thioredoxin family protein n=1 Tax=Paenibacillus sp. J31TS4 TaxID=2807195 RepID=UPI001B17F635|nr:thioredoxin family protein [Paenibacillus sp. J31TS4]GIP37976.1 thioredoxin [Paenibacillus sp. J31TS4]